MLTLKELKKEIKNIEAIKDLVVTYQEIATIKMRKIREQVLRNRKFFAELTKTYKEIKLCYLLEKKKKKIKYFPKKEEVIVFLSANEFLYGNLIWEIWQKVISYLKKSKADLVVIGKVGKYFSQKSKIKNKIFYFELDDEKIEKEKLIKITNHLNQYEKILVFFGKYEGGLVQKAAMEEITTQIEIEKQPKSVTKYLFEPSIEEVLRFFEEEILTVLFHLTLLEHQLAKYAARMVAMSEAGERAKKLEREYKKKELMKKREILSKKQIEIFAAQKA